VSIKGKARAPEGPAGDKAEQYAEGGGLVFAEFYEQWSAAVYRYLVHLVGNSGAADDLFQETWASALEHHHQLRDPKLFAVWIFRIARNAAFNEMRKSRRKCQVWILSNLAAPEDEDQGDPFDR
jgi:RNA polymerase sigma-70 factor (ECF subfamily)